MAWIAPPGGALFLRLQGSYTPPAGDTLRYAYPYAAPPGGNLVLRLDGGSTPPPGGAILFRFGGSTEPPEPPEPPAEPLPPPVPGIRIPWGERQIGDIARLAGWTDRRLVARQCGAGWDPGLALARRQTAPWVERHSRDRQRRSAWDATHGLPARPIRIPWRGRQANDVAASCPWLACRPGPALDVAAPWVSGHAQDYTYWWPVCQQQAADGDIFHVPWYNPAPMDVLHTTLWGRQLYRRICWRRYEPRDGLGIVLELAEPLEIIPGDALHFRFDSYTYDERCTHREPSGWRDVYFYRPPARFPVTPVLSVYIIMNTALLTRVADRLPLEARQMEVSADFDSWCWGFSAQVPRATRDAVDPAAEPVPVEVQINGHTWVMLVESWRESRSFGRDEYTITGRSPSAILSAQYAPLRSYTSTQETLARQLAEAELVDTGWDLDWRIVDWTVPAGAYSYHDQPPIAALQRIVEAAGGRLLTDRAEQVLVALPRRQTLPWTWAAATPDLGISEYVVRRLSREYQPGAVYNAVFVSGEHAGVCCKVLRAGSGGTLVAPMVADALITDVAPARTRGMLEIGGSGPWSRESLLLPLTEPESLPGLLELGMLVEMSERGQTWRGQVIGVRVSAQWSDGVQVEQMVDVERYRGS